MAEERIPTIEAMIAAGRRCEVCPILEEHGIATHCARHLPRPSGSHGIQGLHERRKSGAGGSRENPANLVPSCNWGNQYLEDAVGEHRRVIDDDDRLVLRSGPEFDAMGKRAWRMKRLLERDDETSARTH